MLAENVGNYVRKGIITSNNNRGDISVAAEILCCVLCCAAVLDLSDRLIQYLQQHWCVGILLELVK